MKHRQYEQPSPLQASLQSNEAIESLSIADIKSMYSHIKSTKYLKAPYWESLCCISQCSSNRKEMKLRKQTAARFEDHLDIRSCVSVQTNLALLLSLFLTNEQMLLFQNHRAHSVLQKKSKDYKSIRKSDSLKKDTIKRAIGSFQGLPELRLGSKSGKNLSDGFKQLLGFSAQNKLDRKLLAGIFDKDMVKIRSEAQTFNRSQAPLDQVQMTN